VSACHVQVVMMGFSMGGYVAAAFAARYPHLLAGVLLGACAHDAHTIKWQLVGKMAEAVYAVCSYKTKSQVTWAPRRMLYDRSAAARICSWQRGACASRAHLSSASCRLLATVYSTASLC
jgi:pimeloyl-ACP methyl ester carboxylesterase